MTEELNTCQVCGGIGTIEDPFVLITEDCAACKRHTELKPVHIDESTGTVILGGWPDLSSL